MKRILLLSLLLLSACSSNKQIATFNGKLKAENLPTQLVTISTSRDNYIRLSGGIIIQVPANTLKNANGDSVKLEIKEALKLEEMIAAGLYTLSNGELLASGGMLYIAPMAGQDVKILKPVKVIVPADDIREGMQLFKGEVKDSAINWVAPQPLEVSKPDTRLANGKTLFQNNCAPCHNTTKKIVGPPLFGAIQRWKNDTTAVYEFTKNMAAAINKYPQAACIYNEYRISMPAFPTLTKEDLDDIYKYIHEKGMNKLGCMPAEYAIGTACDSCDYIRKLADSLHYMDGGLTDSSKGNVANTVMPTISNSVIQPPSVYYSFEISAFGWFNVDLFLSKNQQVGSSTLKVILGGLTSPTLYPVMVIPSWKIIQPGNISSNGSYFYFFKKEDGSIQLPTNEPGYIFVLGEKGDTLRFGIMNFVTGGDQTIKINIQNSDKETVEAAIGRLKLQDVKVNIGKNNVSQLKLELDGLIKRHPGCNFSEK
ncbi:cytochrome c [Chitinophaga sp.]|uniref:c-type cytochrome n=1 Tax=Chitinophaga sp. TaxID=1869181 RepID=UPI0031CF9B81